MFTLEHQIIDLNIQLGKLLFSIRLKSILQAGLPFQQSCLFSRQVSE